ncbi:MAG: 50S ribosomal protein L25/general stress protein Ctc [Geminicoccaceae bacterium]
MSDVVNLEAETRERTGKGPNRRLRDEGRVPAVIYGGDDDVQMVSLVAKEVRRELQTNARFFSSVCELKLSDKTIRVVPREAQVHPVTDEAIHLDFIRVKRGSSVTVEVPVTFLNEETSPGLKRGGVLNIVRREIELVCPVEAIPDEITVDLGALDINDSVHISQVSLADGVEPTITDRDFTICTIVAPGGGMQSEEEEDADAGEEDAGEDVDDSED